MEISFRSTVTAEFDLNWRLRYRLVVSALNPLVSRFQFEFVDTEVVMPSVGHEAPREESAPGGK